MGKGLFGIASIVLCVFAITAFACPDDCDADEPVEYLPDSAVRAVGPPLVTHIWYAMRRVEAAARQPIVGKILEELQFVAENQLAVLEYDRTHAQNRMFLHAQAMWHRHWRDSAMAALVRPKPESVVATEAPTYLTESQGPLADAGMPERHREEDSLAVGKIERAVEAAKMSEWNPWDPVNEESERTLLHQWEVKPDEQPDEQPDENVVEDEADLEGEPAEFDEPEVEFEEEGEYEDKDEQAEPADEEDVYMQPWDTEDGAKDLPATRPAEPEADDRVPEPSDASPPAGILRDAIPELPTWLRRGPREMFC